MPPHTSKYPSESHDSLFPTYTHASAAVRGCRIAVVQVAIGQTAMGHQLKTAQELRRAKPFDDRVQSLIIYGIYI